MPRKRNSACKPEESMPAAEVPAQGAGESKDADEIRAFRPSWPPRVPKQGPDESNDVEDRKAAEVREAEEAAWFYEVQEALEVDDPKTGEPFLPVTKVQEVLQAARAKAISSPQDFRDYLLATYDALNSRAPTTSLARSKYWKKRELEEATLRYLRLLIVDMWDMARKVGAPQHPPPPLPAVDYEAAAWPALDTLLAWTKAIIPRPAPDQSRVAQAEGGGPVKLPLSRQKAYRQYRWALSISPELQGATDRQVYDWLADRREEGETLPHFATWQRYLREARAAHDSPKHTPCPGP
jgi:hypothetical protein